MYWARTAKIQWLENVDQSTQFFHAYVKGDFTISALKLKKTKNGKRDLVV